MDLTEVSQPITNPEIQAFSEVHTLTAVNPDTLPKYQQIGIALTDLDEDNIRPRVSLVIESNDLSLPFLWSVIQAYLPDRCRRLAIADVWDPTIDE